MRPFRCIILLLLVLCSQGCATLPAASAGETPPVHADRELTVLSLNIYHDRADWPQRLPLIVAGLRALDPDVIALQEVLQHATLPNQARSLAEALGYEAYFASVDAAGETRRYGNAILTRHPVLQRSWRRLQPIDDGRTVAHVRVDLDGRSIDIYATHLHHMPEGGAIRARQLRSMRDHIAATGDGSPVLLLGDFNASVEAPELQPLQADYLDVWGHVHPRGDAATQAVTTLNPHYFAQPRRIDHMFAQRGRFEVIDARIVLDRPDADGHWPSDHFGLFARLRLLPEPDPAAPGPAPNSVTLEPSSPR